MSTEREKLFSGERHGFRGREHLDRDYRRMPLKFAGHHRHARFGKERGEEVVAGGGAPKEVREELVWVSVIYCQVFSGVLVREAGRFDKVPGSGSVRRVMGKISFVQHILGFGRRC